MFGDPDVLENWNPEILGRCRRTPAADIHHFPCLLLSFQTPGVESAELNAPDTDRLMADNDASLNSEIFDIAVAEIESVVEPDSVGNDIRWKSVSLINIHAPILAISGI